jgi:hypothetical protein
MWPSGIGFCVAQALEKPMPHQVARVPRFLANDRVISPYRMNLLEIPKFGYDLSEPTAAYFAINSYSAISLAFLAPLGGFEPYYWLDARNVGALLSSGQTLAYLGAIVDGIRSGLVRR